MNIYNILKSKIFTIAAVLAVAWLSLSVIKVRSHEGTLKERKEDLSQKSAGIESDNERIAKEIEYGKNPLFLEKEARMKLNLKSPEEEVFFVYSAESSRLGNENTKEEKEVEEMSNFKKWWRYLLGE